MSRRQKLRPKDKASLGPITNETVEKHREATIMQGRKYSVPLSHSRNKVLKISLLVLLAAIIAFCAYTGLALYKFQSTSNFIYNVTKVLPLPVAKVGPHYVSYNDYLFELRHQMHYYSTQQNVNFSSKSGERQLDSLKQQALTKVINDSLVSQLAAKNNVSVTNQEVNNQLNLLRSENKLSNNGQEFKEVLQEFFGWTPADLKRELKTELLAQKVVDKLDTATHQRAENALSKLDHGANFEKLAAQVSDDYSTRYNGGLYNKLIDKSSQDIKPQVMIELSKLKPGQHSGIIDVGSGLEIVEVVSNKDGEIKAAHMSFNFRNVNAFISPLEKQEKISKYISLPKPETY